MKKPMPLELVFPQLVRNTFMKAAHPLRLLTDRLNSWHLSAKERELGRNIVALRSFIESQIEKAKKQNTKE